ncbi:MAG: hypothetical protein WKF79_08725 [Nocardioides sp.]
MSSQVHLARGIVDGRVHTEQDLALLRTVELELKVARRARRARFISHLRQR